MNKISLTKCANGNNNKFTTFYINDKLAQRKKQVKPNTENNLSALSLGNVMTHNSQQPGVFVVIFQHKISHVLFIY